MSQPHAATNGTAEVTSGISQLATSTTHSDISSKQTADHSALPVQPTKHEGTDGQTKLSKADIAAAKKAAQAAKHAAALAAVADVQQGPSTDSSVEHVPQDYITLQKLFEAINDNLEATLDKQYTIQGWIRYVRDQKNVLFLTVSDGTTVDNLQCTFQRESEEKFAEIARDSKIGASIRVTGSLVRSAGKGQLVELIADSAVLICGIPFDEKLNSSYPLAKATTTLDAVRPLQHLRSRNSTFAAILRIRSQITHSMYRYFGDEQDMTYVDIPVLTTSECEGGCQPLQVTSLLVDKKKSAIPTKATKQKDSTTGESTTVRTDEIDFSKDFFDKPVYLTVSNQMHLECFALSHTAVYTNTVASRGEASATSKHLSTFNMIEWETCFTELEDNIKIAEGFIKYAMRYALKKCRTDLDLLEKQHQPGLVQQLQQWSDEAKPFPRITHQEAVERMLADQKAGKYQFTLQPAVDEDLGTEHEKYIVEKMYPNQIVVVKHYPAKVKAFYMPELEDGLHADCYDVIAPRCGEVVGASQRIWKADELVAKMQRWGIDPKSLAWYVELRKLGCVPHGGAGLGFDRLVMLITGMENVKDCVSFVRTIHECEY